MELRLYDTKSRQLQPLEPVHEGHVGIYLCGPTVQDSPHIGHLRAAVSFDVLIRWLQRLGLDVTYIRNITDIDDKILTRAADSGERWWQLASRYEREFAWAYDQLGLLPPTFEPRATAHIIDQINMVQELLDSGHAYTDGAGNVYFDVHSQPDYGSLTHQRLEDMRTTEDSAQDTSGFEAGKRDPRDFALWKAARDTDPHTATWAAPWGAGRPGWHLECSAMSHRYLGETFDIHGGGLDLRFPHHENEQAQSHALGWGFAQMWVHNAWVTVADEKMSKSIGNTLSLQNLLAQHDPAVLRLALGTVHHRSMIEWSDQTLERARGVWQRLQSFVEAATQVAGEPETAWLPAEELPPAFAQAMNDDLNLAEAMAVIYHHIKLGQRAIAAEDTGEVARQLLLVRSMLDVLGIDPAAENWQVEGEDGGAAHQALATLIEGTIEARDAARAAKDWATADALRDQLAQAGVVVEDGPEGSTWRVART